jgi:hypothetical protein
MGKSKKTLSVLKTTEKKEETATTKANHFERAEARTQRSINRDISHLSKFESRIQKLLLKYKTDAAKAAKILGKTGMLTKNQQFVENTNTMMSHIKSATANAISTMKANKAKIDAGATKAIAVGKP